MALQPVVPAGAPAAAAAENEGSDLNAQTSIAKAEEPSTEPQTSEDPTAEAEQSDEAQSEEPTEEPTAEAESSDDDEEPESVKDPEVESTGGGWYKITWPDGSTDKVQGRQSAYEMAGIRDPEESDE